MNRGWQRFTRTLTSQLIRTNQHDLGPTTARLSKFNLPPTQFSGRLNDDVQLGNSAEFQFLHQYRQATLRTLEHNLNREVTSRLVQEQRINYSKQDQTFIERLITDPSITCKPADKNLGLVLVNTDWYDKELNRMLADTNTYIKFNNTRTVNGKVIECSVQQLTSHLMTELQSLVKRFEPNLAKWNSTHYDHIIRYMRGRVDKSRTSIPSIYLLIKVHKPKGLCGRPIVPCTNWITTPASVLVDHLLQEILHEAATPWIVKDTKSLVNELEQTFLPTQDGVFVTADIASLYTNIDTPLGLRLIREFLNERQVNQGHITLIMALLEFVMHHSYLAFKDTVYHQIDGTAMGTACAPTYANIIVYMLERQVIRELGAAIHLYRRFLDDVFGYLKASEVERFKTRLNSLHPKLQFEFVTHPTEATFLDLLIYKGDRFRTQGVFDTRVHQKSMNLYLYLPYNSFHTEATKRSFIQTELMRYIRNSSDIKEYIELKHTFWQRLRDRGYPSSFLLPIFNTIYYSDRSYFLYPSAKLLEHPDLRPASACLIKRMERGQRNAQTTRQDQSLTPSDPIIPSTPVFIVPYSPLSHIFPTRQILIRQWQLVECAIPNIPRPIIAYQSFPSLMVRLVHQKARLMEKARKNKIISKPPNELPVSNEQVSIHRPGITITVDDGPCAMDLSSQ